MNATRQLAAVIAATLISPVFFAGHAAAASTPYPMAAKNYTNNFSDAISWPAGLGGSGTTASNWQAVAVNGSGTIPDGVKTTVSSATFSSGSSGGVQTNSPVGGLTFLSTGNDNATAVAVDLLLDFTGRNAGVLTFDWAEVNNSTGNKVGSLRVYTSVDGTTFTELTPAYVNVTNNVAASGTQLAIALPTAFSGSSTARIRFYENAGTTGGTPSGSRPKIAIDNVIVTSTAPAGNPPVITGITPSSITANAGDSAAFTVSSTGDAANYYWYKTNAFGLSLIAGVNNATLTLTNLLATNNANYFVVLSNATPPMATSGVVSLTVTDPYLTADISSQTRLVGGSVSFSVSAKGTGLGYRWGVKPTADADFTGLTYVANGGNIAGANTSVLTITNLAAANTTNYFVVITNNLGNAVTSSVATLVVTNSASLALWNFNGILNITNPVPVWGVGTAAVSGCTTYSNGPAVASGIDFGGGSPNNSWGTTTYPTNGNSANNKTAGARFSTSTAGAKNIMVTFDTRATSPGSKYERLQYTTNGTDFIDYPTSFSFSQATIFESRSANLTGFRGVANNTNFAIRVVTEFESTARYGNTNNAQYVGIGANYATSANVSYDIVNISAEAITNNNVPPVITVLTNMITTDTDGATTQNFSIADQDGSVGLANVAYSSKDQMIMPDGNIAITAADGTGTNLVFSITPTSGMIGTAPILVTVTDAAGDVTTTWLYATVNPGNKPPSITGLINTNMLGNVTNTFPFTIGDAETAATNLTLTAFSGNTTLVPNDVSFISFGGSGSNRTVIIAPVTNQYGIAPITITVNDGAKTTPLTFVLEVRPNTVTLLDEGFDYDTAGSLLAQSAGFWANHSGSPVGAMQVGSGVATVTDGNAEDVNATFLGQPISSTNKQVLYSSFTLNYSALPTEGGTYFAHFKDNTSSGFYGRLYASTLNAAAGTYRIGIGNVSVTNTTAQIAQDLTPGVNYTVVTRLVLSNGVSTVWINPTDENSSSMTDTTSVSAPSPITSYALRENANEGTLTVDNLKVGLNFWTVITNIVDVPPQANADSSSVTENTTNNVLRPLVNDVLNTLHGALSLVSVSPTNGVATISGTNILFTPTNNFVGTANVGYTITDGFGGTSSAVIAVAVTNIPPQANPDTYTVLEYSTGNIFNPLTNDVVKTVGGSLRLAGVSTGIGSAVITNAGQQIVFTPTPGYSGSDTVSYQVTDGIGGTNTGTITVNVSFVLPKITTVTLPGKIVIQWPDPSFTLQSATNVAGPFNDVPSATSPYTNDETTVPALFFRLENSPPAG
jgi:Bacterial Ig domain